MTNDWTKPEDQRAAATAFLKKTQSDAEFRARVSSDRAYAREQLGAVGDINIPADVEVICLEPGTQARAKLVVLTLPGPHDPMPSDLVALKHWLAAWVPY